MTRASSIEDDADWTEITIDMSQKNRSVCRGVDYDVVDC
jgi:hypothetical protein